MPIWFLIAVGLLNAFKGYLPTISKLSSDKSSVRDCNNKCDELSKQLSLIKDDFEVLNINYEEVNRKYYMLLGSMSVIKSKLKEMGFDDITEMDGKDG